LLRCLRYLIDKHKMNTNPDTQALDLPPVYRAIALREYRDAFTHAQAIAAEEGAGTLVWVRRFDTIEFAVVLEPEQKLAEARCALYAGMNAAADALGSYCPPEKPIEFAWPDTIMLDGGIVGGCRLATPAKASEDEIPDWLVLGLNLRSVVEVTVDQIFERGTSLTTEGFEMMDGNKIIESFSRHLMATFDGWKAGGFRTLADRYLARLQPAKGLRRGLDVNGDLLERRLPDLKEITRQPLTAALAVPQWLDPSTGEPWM
jgi:biotin-(acetyl-CoA carboxylase) ligase